MKKYKFQFVGDNADGSPVLLECTFSANDGSDIEKFRNIVFAAFDNPQRVGAPMSATYVDEIEIVKPTDRL